MYTWILTSKHLSNINCILIGLGCVCKAFLAQTLISFSFHRAPLHHCWDAFIVVAAAILIA